MVRQGTNCIMSVTSKSNPLIEAIQNTFKEKRGKKNGLIPRSWLLVVLCILDMIGDSDDPLSEDDAYTYDYTLKKSRAKAIPRLLAKYSFPLELGMGTEGITTRGAPGLRLFRAIGGGSVIANRPKKERVSLLHEAIELVRTEMLRVVGQEPIKIPTHRFEQTESFVESLLEAVENRSCGRVEQALAGAKLQLRFPESVVPIKPGFAGDQQTGRDCDFEVDNIRVIVSVSPKDQHYASAISLAAQGRTVYLIVADRSSNAAISKIKRMKPSGTVIVDGIKRYVTSNMGEIANDRKFTSRDVFAAREGIQSTHCRGQRQVAAGGGARMIDAKIFVQFIR